MRIYTNELNLIARRYVKTSEKNIQHSLETLSSGKRINHASDDAAGLAISTRMTTQIRGNEIGMKNTKDAISYVQTAEGSLSSIETQLQRVRELMLQAQNSTYSASDKQSMQNEVNQILSNIDHVSSSTMFNGIPVFKQNGMKFDGVNSYVEFGQSFNPLSYQSHTLEARFSPDVNTGATTSWGVFGFHGWHQTIVVSKTGKISLESWFENSPGVGRTAVVIATPANFWKPGEQYIATATFDNATRKVALYVNGNLIGSGNYPAGKQLANYQWSKSHLRAGMMNNPGTIYDYPYNGTIYETRIYDRALSASEAKNNANGNVARDGLAGEWNFSYNEENEIHETTGNGKNGTVKKEEGWEGTTSFSTGANEEDTLTISSADVSSKGLGIFGLDATDSLSIDKIDYALETISSLRSKYGTYQNRLELRYNSTEKENENMISSRSRIEDADMSQEMSELTKEKIISQSSLSMIVQSNEFSKSILQLLQS
jgi:flagellin